MPESLTRLWANRDRECHWCGRQIADKGRGNHDDCASVDHILPRERGGCDGTGDDRDDSNLVLSHRRCNEARAEAGHCIAALICALSVLGNDPRPGAIKRWFIGLRGLVGNDGLNHEKNLLWRRAFPPFDILWPEASALLAYKILGGW